MSQESGAIRMKIDRPVHYNWGGLFIAPDANWVHMHRKLVDFELIVMVSGTLYIADEQEMYEVGEGEYCLFPPMPLQYGWKPSDCTFYWMHFVPAEPEAYEVMSVSKEGACLHVSDERRTSIMRNTHDTIETADKPSNAAEQPSEAASGYLVLPRIGRLGAPARVHTLMQQLSDAERRYMDLDTNAFLATGVLCEISDQIRYMPKFHIEKDAELIEQIEDYIYSHIGEPLHVKTIAEAYGYNEKYLTTIFRQKTGISLKQHIISVKMERAKFLLCNTNATITEIAYNLSYWNEQSFSTAFRKWTEMTPSEYRQMYSAGRVNHV